MVMRIHLENLLDLKVVFCLAFSGIGRSVDRGPICLNFVCHRRGQGLPVYVFAGDCILILKIKIAGYSSDVVIKVCVLSLACTNQIMRLYSIDFTLAHVGGALYCLSCSRLALSINWIDHITHATIVESDIPLTLLESTSP